MGAKCLNPPRFAVDLPGMALSQYLTGSTRRWLCRAGQDARAAQRLVTFGTSISQIMKSDLLDSPPSLEFWRVTVFLRAQPLSTKSMLFTSEPTRHAHVSAAGQPTQSSYQTQGHENTLFQRGYIELFLRIQLGCSCIRFSSISERVKFRQTQPTESFLLFPEKNLHTSGNATEGGPSSGGVLQTW